MKSEESQDPEATKQTEEPEMKDTAQTEEQTSEEKPAAPETEEGEKKENSNQPVEDASKATSAPKKKKFGFLSKFTRKKSTPNTETATQKEADQKEVSPISSILSFENSLFWDCRFAKQYQHRTFYSKR